MPKLSKSFIILLLIAITPCLAQNHNDATLGDEEALIKDKSATTSKVNTKRRGFNIAITPFVDIINGKLGEYVYATNCASSNDDQKYPQGERKLSQLDWKIVNLFEIGLDMTFSCGIFDFSLYGAGGIPRATGVMEDSDWLNLYDEDMKVCYSESDCDITGAARVGTKFRCNFDVLRWLVISPFVTIDYNYWSFETSDTAELWYGNNYRDGPGSYVSYDDKSAAHIKKGERTNIEIDYEKHELFHWIGCEFCANPIAGLVIEHKIAIAPFFATSSVDHHQSGSRYYGDVVISGWKSFRFITSVGYRFAKKFLLKFSAKCEFTLETKGLSLYSSDNTGDKTSYAISGLGQSKSAVDMETWGFSLSFEYKIW